MFAPMNIYIYNGRQKSYAVACLSIFNLKVGLQDPKFPKKSKGICKVVMMNCTHLWLVVTNEITKWLLWKVVEEKE